MTDINLKTETPDTTLPTTGFLFGADSQAAASPSVFTVQSVATTLLGSTTLSGATITANAPVLDLAQTWNNAAVTFTGLKANVTDTASNAASLLMDLQVGGASRFSVNKSGSATLANQLLAAGSIISTVGSLTLQSATAAFVLGNDTPLTRRAAANFRFGAADAAAPVAQTLSVQSVVAGTSNTAGAALTITGSQGTGTGAGGSIIFQVAPAGSSGTAQNALATALTIASDRSILLSKFGSGTDPSIVAYDTGGIRSGFAFPNSGTDVIFTRANSAMWGVGFNRCSVTSAARFSWSSAADPLGTEDLTLFRDASNTLAQRNANNGQIFRLYGRYTDITDDFERFFINAPTTSGDAVQLGTQKGATAGTARALELQTDATTRLTIAATSGNITTTGSVTTQAPTGGTAAAWRLGTVATVTPTLQNRTIEVDIGGTIYYISAKTTND